MGPAVGSPALCSAPALVEGGRSCGAVLVACASGPLPSRVAPGLPDYRGRWGVVLGAVGRAAPMARVLSSAGAMLTLYTAPETRAALGSVALLKCRFNVGRPIDPAVLRVRWLSAAAGPVAQYDRGQGTFEPRLRLSEQELQIGNASLEVQDVAVQDNGTYTCEVAYGTETQLGKTTLWVLGKDPWDPGLGTALWPGRRWVWVCGAGRLRELGAGGAPLTGSGPCSSPEDLPGPARGWRRDVPPVPRGWLLPRGHGGHVAER